MDVEFLADLVLNPLITIKVKTFNAFEGRIIVLHIRWMPAWWWALLFCRMDWWASLRTWCSAERPRACISCTCSRGLRTISGHHITATRNNRSPWRSTWPSQKVYSRCRYLKRSRDQSKSKIEEHLFCCLIFQNEDCKLCLMVNAMNQRNTTWRSKCKINVIILLLPSQKTTMSIIQLNQHWLTKKAVEYSAHTDIQGWIKLEIAGYNSLVAAKFQKTGKTALLVFTFLFKITYPKFQIT